MEIMNFLGVNGCIVGCMIRSDSLHISPEILSLIAGIDEFKGAWRALGTRRRLTPLRDELMRGDLRSLYRGWLAGGNTLHDNMLEPEVPYGLADLSPAQQALVEFLEIDPDLLEAASLGSAAATSPHDETLPISTWLNTWQTADMQDVLRTAANEEAARGSASGYERTVSMLKVLAEGYALVAGPDAFDRQLRRFLVPHAKRLALLRRLAEAGLWSG